ncbi:MAG: DJ-1/PfpI family protein [Candidatus Rickettsiella isopodorum]|jgi:transcriptional regulator GlxA family with amidase domain
MQIVFLFYDGMTALDVVGPHEILCRISGTSIKRVAKLAGNVKTDSGLILTAEYALSDVLNADILFIPGAGNATTLQKYPEILDWVRLIHSQTTWTTSVCTGSLILGAAGILSGVNATTHWAAIDRLTKWGAEPTKKRIVESGKIITAAGVSAGIDMALTLAAKISGEHVAKNLQLGIEYDPEPPFNSGSPEKADPELLENLRKRMVILFEND